MPHNKGIVVNSKLSKQQFFWLPLVIFIVGGLVAFYSNKQQLLENQQQIQSKLSARLEQISVAVVESVTLYQYGLRGLRGAIVTTGIDKFNYTNMQAYSASRDVDKEFPGARGFGLIRRISPVDVDSFVEYARQDRPDKTFAIRQLSPHADSLFIIQYIEPEHRNSEAVGLDIGSEAMRRHAALESAKFNDVRLTGPITLVQANQQPRHGFLILIPIYNSMQPPKTAEERLASIQG